MRGLKPDDWQPLIRKGVASFTDAWIETQSVTVNSEGMQVSHLLQMRGLKPKIQHKLYITPRRIFYRCVD